MRPPLDELAALIAPRLNRLKPAAGPNGAQFRPGVAVAVAVAARVGVGVIVAVRVTVGVRLGVLLAVAEGVDVGVAVRVGVGVWVGRVVGVRVGVAVTLADAVGVALWVAGGVVSVGEGVGVDSTATTGTTALYSDSRPSLSRILPFTVKLPKTPGATHAAEAAGP
jgi:hypothetical protein